MLSSNLLIHIGYPKVASTWLQKAIFNDENAGFITPWGACSAEALDAFALTNSFRFSAEETYKLFEPGLKQANERDLIPVISHESLSGNQMGQNYWGKEVADRMYAVFPDARILIMLREQKSILMSSYQQHIKTGGNKTINRFIGVDINKAGFKPICRLEHLEYDLLISYYQTLFGNKNVLVLPLELLKKDKIFFIKKLLDFTGSQGKIASNDVLHNVSPKAGTLAFRRMINCLMQPTDFSGAKIPLQHRLAVGLSQLMDPLIPESVHKNIKNNWQNCIDDYVQDQFKKSNQKTSELTGINLSEFGYDC
ncbi:MAG: hypothetical protein QNJ51_00190 [Calothrix sp. MO_167.B12]|nr:hypothetical protein [Calothrix sp. MO_167.B12]